MKINYSVKGPCSSLRRKGSTLIEVMLAVVVMLIIVLAGGAFLYHSLVSIVVERNKRTAIEIANSRLEEMSFSNYDDIAPSPADDEDLHYIKKVGGLWELDGLDDETVNINDVAYPITTMVQYIDADGDSPIDSFDFLRVVVSVGYRVNSNERMTLETYIR